MLFPGVFSCQEVNIFFCLLVLRLKCITQNKSLIHFLARDSVMIIFLIIRLFWLSVLSTNIFWLYYISSKIKAISSRCSHLDPCSIFWQGHFYFPVCAWYYVLGIVSWVRCGTWWYPFLIFAFFLTYLEIGIFLIYIEVYIGILVSTISRWIVDKLDGMSANREHKL